MASAVIPFLKNIPAATQDEQTRQVPFSGTVVTVDMAFPKGPHHLVEVALKYKPSAGGSMALVPRIEDTFIALDDQKITFKPNIEVAAPGHLVVEWWNYDSLHSHEVPVIVTLEGRDGSG